MRVYRQRYKTRDGKIKKAARYYVRFRDHVGVWRQVVASTDMAASEAVGRKLERLVALKTAGEPMDSALGKWVDGLSADLYGKLIDWGILNRRASMALLPLEDHVSDWHDSLLNKATTQRQANQVKARVDRIIAGCGFARYSDIDPLAVEGFLASLRGPDGISVRTSNFYMAAAKSFCAWMVANGRVASSPLAHLVALNPKVDVRLERRALTDKEMRTLLQAAENGPQWLGITGPERRFVYELALTTGLRAAELRSLEKRSFDLDNGKPTVTVQAGHSKHRRQDVLPLLVELAKRLRAHLANKLPTAKAIAIPEKTAQMLYADLERAGIDRVDAQGRIADFHSLRVSFITSLVMCGVNPKVAQVLARHSDIKLTMDTYTKIGADDQRVGLESLPSLQFA